VDVEAAIGDGNLIAFRIGGGGEFGRTGQGRRLRLIGSETRRERHLVTRARRRHRHDREGDQARGLRVIVEVVLVRRAHGLRDRAGGGRGRNGYGGRGARARGTGGRSHRAIFGDAQRELELKVNARELIPGGLQSRTRERRVGVNLLLRLDRVQIERLLRLGDAFPERDDHALDRSGKGFDGVGERVVWHVLYAPLAAPRPVIKIPSRRRRQAAARPGYYAMLTVGGCTSALTVIVVGTSRGGAGT